MAINFSLVFVRVLVDAVYVGTVTVLSISDAVVKENDVEDVNDMFDKEVSMESFSLCDQEGAGGNCKPIRDIVNDTFCPSEDTSTDYCFFQVKEDIEVDELKEESKRNIMAAFATQFMRLESLPILAEKTESTGAVLENALFSLIMYVFQYMENVVNLPLFYQNWLRLKEIKNRIAEV